MEISESDFPNRNSFFPAGCVVKSLTQPEQLWRKSEKKERKKAETLFIVRRCLVYEKVIDFPSETYTCEASRASPDEACEWTRAMKCGTQNRHVYNNIEVFNNKNFRLCKLPPKHSNENPVNGKVY